MTGNTTPITVDQSANPHIIPLTDYALAQYGIAPVEMRIIASSLLPTRYPPVWLLCQQTDHAFFADLAYCMRKFGLPNIQTTNNFRKMRPYYGNQMIDEILYERHLHPCLIQDGFVKEPGPAVSRTSRYGLLSQECVRLRLSLHANKFPDDGSAGRLYELLGKATSHAVPGFTVPTPANDKLERYVRMLPLLDPLLLSINSLMRNVCFIPANHARLDGRVELVRADYVAQHTIVKSCIPVYVEQLLGILLERDEQQWVSWPVMEKRMHLPLNVLRRVTKSLYISGVLQRDVQAGRKVPWVRINPEYKQAAREMVEGTMRWW